MTKLTRRMIGLAGLLLLLAVLAGGVWAEANRATVTIGYTYDAAGRLISADYGSNSTTYTYDDNGNLLQRLTTGVPTAIGLETVTITAGQAPIIWLILLLCAVATLYLLKGNSRKEANYVNKTNQI